MKNSRGEIGSFSFHTKGNELQVIPTLLATSCYPGGVVLERFYQQYFVTSTGQSREWLYHCPQRSFSTCHPSRRLNSYKRSYGGKLIRKGKGWQNWVLKKKSIIFTVIMVYVLVCISTSFPLMPYDILTFWVTLHIQSDSKLGGISSSIFFKEWNPVA